MITNRLKNLRADSQFSQKDLADVLGVSQQTVASWESGRTEPSNAFLNSIAQFFDVTTDYLLGNDKAPEPKLAEDESRLLDLFRGMPAIGKQALLMVAQQMQVTAR